MSTATAVPKKSYFKQGFTCLQNLRVWGFFFFLSWWYNSGTAYSHGMCCWYKDPFFCQSANRSCHSVLSLLEICPRGATFHASRAGLKQLFILLPECCLWQEVVWQLKHLKQHSEDFDFLLTPQSWVTFAARGGREKKLACEMSAALKFIKSARDETKGAHFCLCVCL